MWRDRTDPDSDPLRSCVIVTTQANDALSPIHNRMPVVLSQDHWDRWLDPSFDDRESLHRMLVPAPADWFATTAVSTAVNTVANDGPQLLEALPEFS